MGAADSAKLRFWIQVFIGGAITIGGAATGYILNNISDQMATFGVSQTKMSDKLDDQGNNLTKVSTTLTEGAMKTLQSVVETNNNQQVEINNLKDRVGNAEGDLKELRALQNMQLPGQGRK